MANFETLAPVAVAFDTEVPRLSFAEVANRFTAADLESHAVHKAETAIDGNGTEPAPGAHLCDLLHAHGVCRPLGRIVLNLGVCHLRLRFG